MRLWDEIWTLWDQGAYKYKDSVHSTKWKYCDRPIRHDLHAGNSYNTNGATRKSMYLRGDLCLNTCYFPSISINVTFGPILVQATNSECRPDWGKNSVHNYCFHAVQHGMAYKTHYTTIKNNKNSIKTGTRSLVTWFRKTSSRSSMCTRMCVWKTQYCILVNFIQYWKHIFSIGLKVA